MCLSAGRRKGAKLEQYGKSSTGIGLVVLSVAKFGDAACWWAAVGVLIGPKRPP